MPSLLHGFLLGASLIVAIGAQNAFVLRQGLARSHVLVVATLCALSDALLSGIGISGAGALLSRSPRFLMAIAWVGAAYLLWFGIGAFRRALRPSGSLDTSGSLVTTRRAAIVTTLLLTYLNPHVYLDTVLLLGSIGAQEPVRWLFWLGAVVASFAWFFGLSFGARLLRPWLTRPRAWRMLDGVIGLTMVFLAVSLVGRTL